MSTTVWTNGPTELVFLNGMALSSDEYVISDGFVKFRYSSVREGERVIIFNFELDHPPLKIEFEITKGRAADTEICFDPVGATDPYRRR